MRKMKEMKKFLLVGMMLLTGSTMMSAEENNVTNEVDTTYIKLDENREPINHVNLTYDELVEKVGELETILETDAFQLYAAGDYTYKIEDGIVTSMAIQIADDNTTSRCSLTTLKATRNSPSPSFLPTSASN